MELKRVAPEDVDELVRIRIAAMEESLRRIGRFDPTRARERLLSGFSPEHTHFIHHDAAKVGFVVVKPELSRLKLDHLYIEPRYQSCGIGGQVLQWLLNQADQQGLEVVVTAPRGSATSAMAFRGLASRSGT